MRCAGLVSMWIEVYCSAINGMFVAVRSREVRRGCTIAERHIVAVRGIAGRPDCTTRISSNPLAPLIPNTPYHPIDSVLVHESSPFPSLLAESDHHCMLDIMRSWPAIAAAAVILLARRGAAEGLDATGKFAEEHPPLHMLLKRSPVPNPAWKDVLGADHDYGGGRPNEAVLFDCVEAGKSRCPASQAALVASNRIKSVDRPHSTEDLAGEVRHLVKRGRPTRNVKRPSDATQPSSPTPLPSSSQELPAKQGRGRLRRYPELFKAAMRTSLGSIRPHEADVSIIRAPQREGGVQVSIRDGHERWDIPFEESSLPAARKRVAPSKTAEGQRKYRARRRANETPEDRQKRATTRNSTG